MSHAVSSDEQNTAPFRSFFKALRPELPLLAVEFVGGIAIGGTAGAIAGNLPANPAHIIDDVVALPALLESHYFDRKFFKRLQSGASLLPEKTLNCLSLAASYTGALTGNALALVFTQPHAYAGNLGRSAAVLGVTGLLVGASRLHRPSSDSQPGAAVE